MVSTAAPQKVFFRSGNRVSASQKGQLKINVKEANTITIRLLNLKVVGCNLLTSGSKYLVLATSWAPKSCGDYTDLWSGNRGRTYLVINRLSRVDTGRGHQSIGSVVVVRGASRGRRARAVAPPSASIEKRKVESAQKRGLYGMLERA
jgi:hypothetical protein